MKGHWIPPSPKGFIDRIAAKLGYSKTIPTGLGSDVVEAVGTLNDQKANQATLAPAYNGATAPAGGIPANSFYYHNGVLYFTDSTIAQGTTLPSGTVVNGLNKIQEMLNVYNENNVVLYYKVGNLKIITGAPQVSGNNEWVTITRAPSQFRPWLETYAIASGYSAGPFPVRFTTGGTLQVFLNSSYTNIQIFLNFVYV